MASTSTSRSSAPRAYRRIADNPALVLLVVDVGNTQTHLGAYRGEELVHDWRFATVRESTADELGARLRNLLALRDLGFADIDASILSSTVPQLRPEWTAMAERYLGHEMPVVGPGVRTGMPIRMDNPREVGADRLVNAVAAYERARRPVRGRRLRHRDHLRLRRPGGRVHRRHHRPGRGDLDGGAHAARRRDPEDRPRPRRGR